jgi:hypothetical protein
MIVIWVISWLGGSKVEEVGDYILVMGGRGRKED